MGKIQDGSGEWLFVNDFHAEEVSKVVAPYLGKPDEISYHIGKQRLTVKRGKDRNTISIYLQNDSDVTMDGALAEPARVW
jgi:hypothetical protein